MATDRFRPRPIRDAIDSFLNRLPLWFVVVGTVAVLAGMLWALNQIHWR